MGRSRHRKKKAKERQATKRNDSGMNDAGSETTAETAVRGDTGITVRVFGRTDVGLVREHNEDNFLIADLTAGNRSIRPEVRTHNVGDLGTLFIVCDGMGGAAAGEVASRIGVDTIYEMMQQEKDTTDTGKLALRLEEAIREAGTRIYTAARLNRGQRGMGTTVTAAVLAGPRLVLGQVGDSRAHVIRQGRLVQVTKDQSLVQQLIDAKQLTEEEAKNFDRSNIILQALGTTEEVHVDITSVVLRRGDALVMCSDGLSGPVTPEEILQIATEQDEPMETCRLLTERACEQGGDDNITVVVARFDGEGLEPPLEGDELVYEKYDFPRVTETTVRTPMPRPPAEEKKPVEAAPAAAAGKAPVAAGKAPVAAAPAAVPESKRKPDPQSERPQAVAKKRETEERPGGSKAGPVVAVLAVLAIGGVLAAYFGGAFSSNPVASEQGDVAVPAVAPPVEVPVPAAPPKRVDPPPVVEAPPLAPIAAEDIEGNTDEPAPDRPVPQAKKAASAEVPTKAATEKKPVDVEAEEPKLKKSETEEAAAEPPKKAAKKKAGGAKSGGGAELPDNPF